MNYRSLPDSGIEKIPWRIFTYTFRYVHDVSYCDVLVNQVFDMD